MSGNIFIPRTSSIAVRAWQSCGFSLGYGRRDLPLALTAQQAGLPDPEIYLSNVWAQAWPQVLAFAGAVLAVLAGVMILRAFQK